MLFNSYTFFLFFILAFAISRVIGYWPARKFTLLLVSYLFYALWSPPFVALLWMSTVVSWLAGKRIDSAGSQLRKRMYLTASLIWGIGGLCYFKYFLFLIDNLNALLGLTHAGYVLNRPDIVLPVGISFYTFQTLSYVIDVYRGKFHSWHSLLDYALYVTFFPLVLAGPIVRASDFLPQCREPQKAGKTQIGWGLSLLVIGLFAKTVIADTIMSPVVQEVYDSEMRAGFLSAWTGTLAFSTQIYSDFFGYSTCAVGIALCFGFSLPDNFRFPYASVGFSDFWRRWHISLSSWFRDYTYITLGGSRAGEMKTYRNLGITMLLCGLWHGASWMFVIWGALHGVFLASEHRIAGSRIAGFSLWKRGSVRFLLSMLTFVLVCFAWVFFRAHSLHRAFSICSDMFNFSDAKAFLTTMSNPEQYVRLGKDTNAIVIGICLLMLAVHAWLRDSSLEAAFAKIPWYARSAIISVMMYLVLISMTGADRAFLYFQF
jgi:alginate O-acetyltransferase complex protein AlgI